MCEGVVRVVCVRVVRGCEGVFVKRLHLLYNLGWDDIIRWVKHHPSFT